jgi:hypothetical protein
MVFKKIKKLFSFITILFFVFSFSYSLIPALNTYSPEVRIAEAVTCPDGWTVVNSVSCRMVITSPIGSNGTFTSPANWNNSDNTIEVIGGGGSGAGGGGTLHGTGGGGGAYSRIANFSFANPGTTQATYRVGAGGSGNGGGATWFNASSDPGGGSDNTRVSAAGGLVGESGAGSRNGGLGGATANSWGEVKNAGGRGGNLTGASGTGGSGGGGAGGPTAPGNAGGDSTSTGANVTTAGGAGNGGTGSPNLGGSGGNAGQNNGGDGTFWGSSPAVGSGGGGGGNSSNGNTIAGSGGNYGGGGGGVRGGPSGTPGVGQPGVIIITYTPAVVNTTILATGTDPSSTTVAPESGIIDAGAFTLQTDDTTDSITTLTVVLAGSGTPYNGVAEVRITSDNGSTLYYSAISNPSSNTLNFSGGTPIPVSTTQTQFKIRITPKTHANMPAVPGAEYALSPYVSDFTSGNSYEKSGTDTNANTLTIDNLSPQNVTSATATAGNAQVSLAWTNPADSDLSQIIVLRRAGTATSDVPTEGASYSVGNTVGDSTVACVVSAPTNNCTDSSLTNGTAYHYRIYAKDSRGNYSQTGVVPTGSPATPIVPGRYWVGGGSSANWDATGPTNWSATSGGANNASIPTSADDVFFDSASNATDYTVDVTGTVNTRNITIGNPASGVVTIQGAGQINVAGDFSASSGILFKMSGGITFTATSGTKTITTNGNSMGGRWTFNGPGGTFQLADNFTWEGVQNSARAMTLTAGTFDPNGKTVTLNAGAGGPGLIQEIIGAFTFYNLTLTNNASGQRITLGSNITVTNNLVINGVSSTNRAFISSNTLGTPSTITAANVSVTNADFRDITGAGAGNWNLSAVSGGSGDAGGNSGITFTTSQTNYWVGNTGNWDDVSKWANTSGGTGGTGRVPLPQDDVVFDANSFSTTGQTVTANMPRLGKNIVWTGVTNTPAFRITAANASIFGSLTLDAGMTLPATTQSIDFQGRGAYTLTSAGLEFSNYNISLNAPGGTLTLQDSLTIGDSKGLAINNGSFDANNFNVTTGTFTSSNSNVRSVSMGSGTWTINTSSIANQWFINTANLTFNAGASTLILSSSRTTSNNFYGGGLTYNNLVVNASDVSFFGSNTFNNLALNNAGVGIGTKFTAGTTQTVTTFETNGSAGNLVYASSTSASATATLAKAGGGTICVDYMHLTWMTGSPADTWYVGANSTNGGNNSGMNFSDCAIPGRYWVGGGSSANWDATGPTNWSETSGGANNASVPGADDDVYFDANSGSGTVTVDATANTKNLDFTGFTGTLAGGSQINIFGNLVAGAGMTWNHNSTPGIVFSATSGTQTIRTNGVQIAAAIEFNGVGGTFQLLDTLTLRGGNRGITLTNGTFDPNGQTVIMAPSTSSGTQPINGAFSFYNLTLTPAYIGQTITVGSNITVTNNLVINGVSSTNRAFISSNTLGTSRTITAANVSVTNADFQDITGAGAGNWNLSAITGGSGDAGGNSGITFTTGQTNYWVGGGTANWSDVSKWANTSGGTGGTGRVPLPQDDAVLDANSGFVGTVDVDVDMPRIGRNIDWTGVPNNPRWDMLQETRMYGNLTLATTMRTAGTARLVFAGRGSHTIRSNGTGPIFGLSVEAFGGTYTLLDSYTQTGQNFLLSNGTFDMNGYDFTTPSFRNDWHSYSNAHDGKRDL